MTNPKHTIMGIRELVLQRNIEEGIQVGKSKRSREIVTNLLTMTDLAIEKIADIVGVTVAFVEEVKASL